MESSPRKIRDSFTRPWWTLNFHLPLGGLRQIRDLKFFTLFFGGASGEKGESPPTSQKFTHPHTRKTAPVDPCPQQTFIPLTKGLLPPPLNNSFHVITQLKLHF